MGLFGKDRDAITASIIAQLSEDTNFSAFKQGDKLRGLVDAISTELAEAYSIFDANTAASMLSGATGPFIDLIGASVNVTRNRASAAKASAASETVKFYVSGGGTFGSINGGNPIIISAGTKIQSGVSGARPITYFVTTSKTLAADATEGYVSVESQESGGKAIVGEGILVNHNFSGYADATNRTLLVKNVKAITSAQRDETDNDMKVRIKTKTLSNEGANLSAIRNAALKVPDVASVYIEELTYGIGTVDLFIQSIAPSISDSILQFVQFEVDKVKAGGTIVRVRKPEEIGITLSCQLSFKSDITAAQKEAIKARVQENLRAFIDTLPMGIGFTRQELIRKILDTDPNISRIGFGKSEFESMIAYIPSYLGSDVKVARAIPGDVIVKPNEKVLVEPSVANPISIR